MNEIKVNLPASQEAFESGNGEGVWVIVSDEVKAAHDNDETGIVCEGILDNDSIYYPSLLHGEAIPFELRGDCRPVTPFTWLHDKYGEAIK